MHRTPGGLGRLRVRDGVLHLEVLDDDGHHLAVAVPLDHAGLHALHHLHALHEEPTAAALTTRPCVDVLIETVAAVGGHVHALVISEGPPPAFHLAVRGITGVRDVAVDAIDAAGLIFSRRVRLEVRADPPDWDRELADLLAPPPER